MDEVKERNKNFQSKESQKHGRDFKPRESDVFIVTYPKCGTTWMSQILHSLRSNGDLSFGEITEVVPWDILALDCGQDLNADHKYLPRLFKSHESFEDIAKNSPMPRYVYVCRDPFDAFVSFYKFLPQYMNVSLDRVSMLEFANSLMGGASHSGLMCDFYLSWYKALKQFPKNVLWIFFEDMKENLEAEVRKVNKWLGITTDEKTIQLAVEQSSFQFMKQHVDKFDDHFIFNKRKAAMGLSHLERPQVAKVRDGKTGSKKILDAEVKALLVKDWQENFERHTNIKNYQELKQMVKQLQKE